MRNKKSYTQMRNEVLNDLSDPRHGTSLVVSMSYRCPCDKCRKQIEDLKLEVRLDPNHKMHGTQRCFSYLKCRCSKCTKKYMNNQYKINRVANWDRIGIKDFSWNDYNTMYAEQKGKCKICGEEISLMDGEVDHNHSHDLGNVRGILCRQCNNRVRTVECLLVKKMDSTVIKKIEEYLKGE